MTSINDNLNNWEASMRYGTFTVKKILGGSSPLEGVLKLKQMALRGVTPDR